jgi:hypothetical protein
MGKWFSKNFKAIIYFAFLVPIITVAIVSISHVTQWYGISNPLSWAVYLSIGIEIAALSALAAISAQMGSKVYVPFGIVTLIQFVGNIFFAFEYIKIDSEQFLSWVELVGPILEYSGIEQGDLQSHRRFLAIFAGGMLPLISLSFLHMLVKFQEENNAKKEEVNRENSELGDETIQEDKIDASDLVAEVSRFRPSQEELDRIEDLLKKYPHNEIKKEPKERITKEEQRELLKEMVRQSEELGLYDEPFDNPLIKEDETPEPPSWMDEIPEPTEEDYGDWDSTLEDGLENEEWDEDHALDQVLNDMVEDLPQEEVIETTEEIKKIDVVLDELPESTNIEFDVEVKTETPEPTATNRPANRYEQLEEYLVQTRSWDQTEQEDDVQLPDSVETAQLDIQTGKITTPEPTEQPKPNFIVREPIQDQEDPEKKN